MLRARLTHGGIMANYICTAACRHCAYACSPDRTPAYITRETSEQVARELKKGGYRSVHIGGGEPFLNFEGLLDLLEVLCRAGIPVDYIETNGYWSGDEAEVKSRLRE
ncbi:MAG: radical SAM protein, partial [Oscillospiraceae bacterium]|nr:radical SAM protein [Oscillospiraceae bacterium]